MIRLLNLVYLLPIVSQRVQMCLTYHRVFKKLCFGLKITIEINNFEKFEYCFLLILV